MDFAAFICRGLQCARTAFLPPTMHICFPGPLFGSRNQAFCEGGGGSARGLRAADRGGRGLLPERGGRRRGQPAFQLVVLGKSSSMPAWSMLSQLEQDITESRTPGVPGDGSRRPRAHEPGLDGPVAGCQPDRSAATHGGAGHAG